MSQNEVSQLLSALRDAGLKLTPQRLAIAEAIAGDCSHPTAQQLHERLAPRFPTMSVATVYNTLSALIEVGQCRSIHLGAVTRFDPNVSHHDHAVCDRCGAMVDVPCQEGADRAPGRALRGFRVAHIERVYRGLCAPCAGAASPEHS
ncbi:MAG: transcriptional repressor [Myxococcales bacterium]|nr:transcriptional repressor [Myxococcales bacterium]